MNEKTFATVALKEEYSGFQAVLRDAAHWVKAAADQGADLVVLPESINLLHTAEGAGPLEHYAFEDWRAETAPLCEAAVKAGISLVLPLLVREAGLLANRFYVLGRDGAELGFYQKRIPACGEQLAGVAPGITAPIPWEGLRIGGGICIDVYFPHHVFAPQAEAGADLFIIPSMTPGGSLLDSSALTFGVPFVFSYSPWSRILDRDARELAAGGYRSETLRAGFGTPLQQATINFNAVSLFPDFNQVKLRDVQRHYGKKVRLRFDQSNCVFLLESRSADLSIAEIMRQFELVSRSDYLAGLLAASTHRTGALQKPLKGCKP